MGGRFTDLTGQRFNRFLVLFRATNARTKGGYLLVQWYCRCDCGAVVILPMQAITSGNTKSCGCLKREVNHARLVTHGMSRSAEYKAWHGAKSRCTNPATANYADYGGRGIRMADEWLNDFQAFFDHLGPRPSPAHSVDRIDNDGHYEPGNVRWATRSHQNNNQRNSIRVFIGDALVTITEAAQLLGLKRDSVASKRGSWAQFHVRVADIASGYSEDF